MSCQKKLILVIGATGAQGIAVIDALLAYAKDGSPSPWAIRALTRNPENRRAKELESKGVELFKGAFDDFNSVREALRGVYGAFVNTDGFTVTEAKEINSAIRLFELAKEVRTVRHYVWSNLDYALKLGGWDPQYRCVHSSSKGKVGEWITVQPSEPTEHGMSWTQITTGPYMDMLYHMMFGPLNIREDGTRVFASPIEQGKAPMIALADIGFFARYTFDNREKTSGQDLQVASELVSWDNLVETFTRVTGHKAVYVHQTIDEWMDNFHNVDVPLGTEEKIIGPTTITWRQNFSAWWCMWRDGIVMRDMNWIRGIHPDGYTLERWMREEKYEGIIHRNLLKLVEDGDASVRLNLQRVSTL
ncbi:NAD(P)-binding protein [Panus rudis PR-1116 ss-1]|nr:NAD(P)-binding protein [Panus rudis PR-1116 ss-1]